MHVILQGDALALDLDDASVDLVLTSPPYFGLRGYEDDGGLYAEQVGSEATPQEYLDALLAATKEAARVLRPTGSLWVNLGDKYSDRAGPEWSGSSDRLTSRGTKPRRANTIGMAARGSLLGLPWRYAIRCVDELGLVLRQEVVWDKSNAMPESVRNRCRRSHEQWFHFTLHHQRYYCDMDQLREPHRDDRKRPPGGGGHYLTVPAGELNSNLPAARRHPAGRLPSTVWRLATSRTSFPAHLVAGLQTKPAPFPTEWPRRIISAWCPPDGVVLDPFGGTGTTALVADVLGRVGISVDRSAAYCRLAEWRCADPTERERAARRR